MIGKTISHYRVIEKLGEGGMGVVYKAEDTKLKRSVALKFLTPELIRDKETKKRFIHEAQAASVIQHVNICTIHEIDQTDDGQMFICMDYYEGESLKKKLEGEKLLSIDKILDIAIQIAQGLTIAHESKIIHRDLKPANIIITNRGEVKIVDFGLAKLAGQTKLTKEGTTLGTVAYMSPEQTRGEKADHRSDIWQLGVILYEMLTGQLPFKGDYDQAIMYTITNENPAPITGLRSGISLELERIVSRMLSKDAQDRYQHADDLLSELNRLKKDSDSKISPTKPESVKKKNNKYLIPTIIFSIFILIVVGYLLVQPIQDQKTDTSKSEWENSIAVLPFKNISADPHQEYFCDGITEQIITNLTKLKALKVIARTSVMPYKDTKKKIPEIGKELNVINILVGSVSRFGDRLRVTAQLVKSDDGSHLWADNYDYGFEIDSIFAIYDNISEKIAKELLQKLSLEQRAEILSKRPTNLEAYNYFMQANFYHYKKMTTLGGDTQDFETSEQLYLKAIELDPDYAPYYANLTDLYNSYFNIFAETDEKKEKYLKLQEKYLKKALDIDPDYSEVQDAKGFVHAAKGEFEEEFACRKKAIQLNPNSSRSIENLAQFYIDRGLLNLALKYYSLAIEADPLDKWCFGQRARCYADMGDFTNAENDFKKAIAIDENYALTLILYTYFLIRIGKYTEADKIIKRNERYNPDIGLVNLTRAVLYAISGEKEKALITYKGTLIANLYAWLGMKDEFFNNFIKYENFFGGMYIYHSLKKNPDYHLIRSDSRFQKILAKYKEKYEENLRKYGDINL